jgi:hypothetical protein
MPTPFEVASHVTPLAALRYEAHIPDGWQQGRGAFGGLVLATLLRAMRHAEGDARRLPRSLSSDLCAPALVGPATIEVSVLRRGRNLSNLDARMIQSGDVVARASAVFSEARAVHLDASPDAPPAHAHWHAIEPAPVGPPFAPVFTQHFAFRNTGALPFTGHARAETGGFVSEREAPAALDASAVVGLLDAWWPAVFASATQPRAAATTSFTAEFLVDPSTLAPAEPLRYRARAVAARDGFSVEFRELWSGDTIVALNQQTFALLA